MTDTTDSNGYSLEKTALSGESGDSCECSIFAGNIWNEGTFMVNHYRVVKKQAVDTGVQCGGLMVRARCSDALCAYECNPDDEFFGNCGT